MRDWNMQDRNMRHQIAGMEYAGLENATEHLDNRTWRCAWDRSI